MPTYLLLLVLLAAAGALGIASYQQRPRQARLDAQLEQLDWVLQQQNATTSRRAGYAVGAMDHTVFLNYGLTDQVTLLQTAQRLRARTTTLLDTLRARRQQLLHATGNLDTTQLRHPDAQPAVARLLGSDARSQQALSQQAAAYQALLHLLYPADLLRIAAPNFDNTPTVAALARLTQWQSDVLAAEARTLRHLGQLLAKKAMPGYLLAAGPAESDIVAPGETYRARLFLVYSLAPSPVRMFCNGQPLAIGPQGQGLVRFRAPIRPGPATWTGTICLNQYGRDTTYQVRVPYRVARR
ncbi:MAG: hypothetical protein ACRYFX_03865 [Janthinobacterium lividum]